MGMEQIKEFLSSPQLPDVIAYVLTVVLFVYQFFMKRFVKKDNTRTLFSVDAKTEKLKGFQAELNARTKEAGDALKLFEEQKAQVSAELAAIKKELNEVKQVVRAGFGSTESLVKSGFANKAAKILCVEKDEPIFCDEPGEDEHIAAEADVSVEKESVL